MFGGGEPGDRPVSGRGGLDVDLLDVDLFGADVVRADLWCRGGRWSLIVAGTGVVAGAGLGFGAAVCPPVAGGA